MHNQTTAAPSIYAQVERYRNMPTQGIPRSAFDLSYRYKSSFAASWLIPFYVQDILPGDTFTLSMSALLRLSTPIKPLMDDLFLESWFFFVPNRLNQYESAEGSGWEEFITSAQEGALTESPVAKAKFDYFGSTSPKVFTGSIADYMGLPTNQTIWKNVYIDPYPMRSYTRIYNEWFRDENLIVEQPCSASGDPDDNYTNADSAAANFFIGPPFSVSKYQDYFTTALPWPQKGSDVLIPFGLQAPVHGIGKFNQNFDDAGRTVYESGGTTSTTYAHSAQIGDSSGADYAFAVQGTAATGGFPNIYADTSALPGTINQLREAEMIQQFYETDARSGSRYVEHLYGHFKVSSPDMRLQRSELLGGGRQQFAFFPVQQTSETGASTPQGNLAAYSATFAQGAHGFHKSFVEHGWVIGLIAVRAPLTYQNSVPRMFTREDRFEYYFPEFAHLGEEPIFNYEIYQTNSAVDLETFGYKARYDEYRQNFSKVTGYFNSNSADSLDIWHLGERFATLPTLNDTFIYDDTIAKLADVLTIAEDFKGQIYMDAAVSVKAVRPLPTYAIPGIGRRM